MHATEPPSACIAACTPPECLTPPSTQASAQGEQSSLCLIVSDCAPSCQVEAGAQTEAPQQQSSLGDANHNHSKLGPDRDI
mmetsp:Transcript_30449/g.51432  ORF Transcript_30449/g.51432 Transcript_30449/m.51432 type:complete len:81 (+) Transcript_30449:408-650(+)